MVDRKLKSVNEELCLGGDFNEVSNKYERLRKGRYHNRRDMEEFRGFIDDLGLVDVPCVGGKFTWYKSNGKTMNRPDRFFLSRNLIDVWEVVNQRVGCRDILNHTPIWLKTMKLDWGPKAFRVNNTWFNHEGFKSFIRDEWAKFEVVERGDYVLYEKIKRLKIHLREWNHEFFG